MKFLEKYKYLFILLFLSAFYFALRLVHLGSLPIFTDEAIYIRWAQIGGYDPNWRFISLVDGKQPLFVWFIMLSIRLISDPLIAGRIVSVFAGFFTLLGIFALTRELFKSTKISLLAVLLYVVFPFAQVYDRMALMDGMVGTFAVWGSYFSVLLVRKIRLDIAYTLGFIIGAGAITKSSGFFTAYLLPFSLLLFDFNSKIRIKQLLRWGIFAGFAFLLSEVIYNLLRLSPFFYIIAQKNASFVFPFSEWIHHPFQYFLNNLLHLSDWAYSYLTPSYLVLILASFILAKEYFREKLLLLLYFILPFIALALFGKSIFPRYIYFMTLSLIPIAALGLSKIIDILTLRFNKFRASLVSLVTILIIVIYPLTISLLLVFNPFKAQIAESDINQYITRWPAGWGVSESVDFFNRESKNRKIFIATQGTFGLMPFSYEIFLRNNPNITIKGYWPINDSIPADVVEKSKVIPTYFVFYQPCAACSSEFNPPVTWSVKPVFKANYGSLTVYQVMTPE